MKDRNHLEYIASTAIYLFHKLYREGKKSDNKLPIQDIIKEHKKKWFFADFEITDEIIAQVTKIINEDEIWLADYEVKNGFVQRIEYPPFTFEWTTSGKVIIENDLRDFFTEADYDVNSTKGIIQTMDDYAKQGMLHGFVGNSCPTLYINRELGIIHVGCAEYDEESGENLPPEGFEELAFVCTDLWWYSIVDVEVLKGHKDFNEEDFEVYEIPAGTWKLTHKYGISERGYHENLPYATLELLK